MLVRATLRTCCKGMVFVALSFVSAESMLCGLVRCEIDGMRGTCTTRQLHSAMICVVVCAPAPITTLDNPLHNDQNPSARDMVTMAFDMPLYMALGEGLTICILVCWQSAHDS
jgi:hypothetical protein